jgi:oligoendopeptidase F
MNAPIFLPDAPPRWSLDDLYTSRTDPRIEGDLAAAEAKSRELAALEGQFVGARAEPTKLGALIDQGVRLSEQAVDVIWPVAAYASLSASVDHGDPAWTRFEADVRARGAKNDALTLFFTLELNQLTDAEINAALAAHPAAARWAPWLRRVRASRPHELSADLERMLVDRAPAVANWTRLYDDILAKLEVKVGRDRLTLSEALNRLSDPSPRRRRAAGQALAKALSERTETLALAYNTIAAEKEVEDRWRRFADPAAARHLANEVDAEAVAALEAAVVEAYPAFSHRYYRLKAKAMGRRALDHWDRNAPLTEASPRLYTWREAKTLVLDCFGGLTPTFEKTAEAFLAAPWTDAEPRTGKQSGAYSHPVTATRHPYVFLNYMGERRDVLTLAHELGHAVHQTLAAPHGTLLADTPLTLAETASIFGEGLVFERLLAEATPPERRDLLAGRIEDALNSVVRQIAFHRFETRFHVARRDGEVSPEAIGAIWLEVMGESLGPAITLNPGYEHYWAYVSHFVHTPFYVYAYAFGNLLVESLMAARAADPAGFAPAYEALLAAGGTETYVEALAPFGLDPRKKEFWAGGVARLTALVDEFEALT